MTPALGYVRCSTRRQKDTGLGLAAERAAITKHAEAHKLEIVQWFEDAAYSGGDDIEHRPGLAEALSALKKGWVLVVAKRERMARNVEVAIAIEAKVRMRGASVQSCLAHENQDDSHYGKFLRRLFDLLAELERDMTKARTKAAREAARERGEYPGAVAPYGYKRVPQEVGGRTIWKLEESEEGRIVSRAKQLRKEGASWAKIADTLLSEGFKPRRADRFHPTQVRRMMNHDTVGTART